MTTLNITAGQVCTGDIIRGYEVTDFDIDGGQVFVELENFEGFTTEVFERDEILNVETDYLDRAPDVWESDDIEDVQTDEVEFSDEVGDLLDH